jgi:translation initiation factor 2 subunit 1
MDLSKIQVKGVEPQKCEERYQKAKIVHTIIRRVAINLDMPLIDLYNTIIWPLNKQEGGALAAFKMAAE